MVVYMLLADNFFQENGIQNAAYTETDKEWTYYTVW